MKRRVLPVDRESFCVHILYRKDVIHYLGFRMSVMGTEIGEIRCFVVRREDKHISFCTEHPSTTSKLEIEIILAKYGWVRSDK